jgi:hypothetical protein
MQDEPWRCGYYITFEKGGNRREKNGERVLEFFLGNRIP